MEYKVDITGDLTWGGEIESEQSITIDWVTYYSGVDTFEGKVTFTLFKNGWKRFLINNPLTVGSTSTYMVSGGVIPEKYRPLRWYLFPTMSNSPLYTRWWWMRSDGELGVYQIPNASAAAGAFGQFFYI